MVYDTSNRLQKDLGLYVCFYTRVVGLWPEGSVQPILALVHEFLIPISHTSQVLTARVQRFGSSTDEGARYLVLGPWRSGYG